jgi:hypothetical protein
VRLSAAGEGVFTVLDRHPQVVFFRNMTFLARTEHVIDFAGLFLGLSALTASAHG